MWVTCCKWVGGEWAGVDAIGMLIDYALTFGKTVIKIMFVLKSQGRAGNY